MTTTEKSNILVVDDQPAKLLSYDVILESLDANVIKAGSARQAFEFLLKMDIAVILVDVCMPELNGFELATMIREHPRFQRTAIIFISAINVSELDHLRGYSIGGVDYVQVPVVPEVLRAKVQVFLDLYRKTRELEQLNHELERRVSERTAESQRNTVRLQKSEQRRSLALAAGRMGSWDWDLQTDDWQWDEGQYQLFGVDSQLFVLSAESIKAGVHSDDRAGFWKSLQEAAATGQSSQSEFRIVQPTGEVRWCIGAVAPTTDASGRTIHISGVTVDISERKQAEERQALLAREVDHRARNTLAVVQAILRLSKAKSTKQLVADVESRIQALAVAHTLLSENHWQSADLDRLVNEELAPYGTGDSSRMKIDGPGVRLKPAMAQTLALVLHELGTNAAKHGALSRPTGQVDVSWTLANDTLLLNWRESGGPRVQAPASRGFGTRMIGGSIESSLGGRVSREWRPEGLHCTLEVPMAERIERDSSEPSALQFRRPQSKNGAAGSGPRILLVEDEFMVAGLMKETLSGFGYAVVGPFSTIKAAAAAIVSQPIDGAVLDINLAGELVYPVADLLQVRSIPFVFVTGYDASNLDMRHAATPVVQKPVDPKSLQRLLADLLVANAVLTPAQVEQRNPPGIAVG